MARSRIIKPDFFEDTLLAETSPTCRLFYVGLWCWMDRQGVVEENAKLLRAKIFPYDEEITSSNVQAFIDQLIYLGRLRRVAYQGKHFLYCKKFSDHQKFHPEEKQKYFLPEDVLNQVAQTTVQPPTEDHLGDPRPPANNALSFSLSLSDLYLSPKGDEERTKPMVELVTVPEPAAASPPTAIAGRGRGKASLSKGKSGEKTQAILRVYCDAWKARYGTNPIVDGKTIGLATNMLKSVSPEKLGALVQAYLQMDDQFFKARSHDFPTFVMQINKVVAALHNGTQDPHERDYWAKVFGGATDGGERIPGANKSIEGKLGRAALPTGAG